MYKITLLVLLVGCIAAAVGATWASVGEPIAGGVYTWKLPVVTLVLLAAPAIVGYLIGRE